MDTNNEENITFFFEDATAISELEDNNLEIEHLLQNFQTDINSEFISQFEVW